MTREIAVEFARKNSRCFGPVELQLITAPLGDPARRNRRVVHIAMGRFSRPEETANASPLLAGAESSFIGGSSFAVDRGLRGIHHRTKEVIAVTRLPHG